MTPTIVLKDGKPFLVTGSPGGSRIITTVLQVMLNVIDYGMPIAAGGARAAHASSVAAGRGDGRARPAARAAEGAGGARPQDRAAGVRPFTSANSIHGRRRKGLVGAADTRTRGALAAGY